MSSLPSLHKRLEAILAKLEPRLEEDTTGRIIIYDPASRQPLPGYEPNLHAVNIWIPNNSRGDYPNG